MGVRDGGTDRECAQERREGHNDRARESEQLRASL